MLTPDHLSALSALSVGGSWRSFSLGARWALGHSTGLLLVTAFLVLSSHSADSSAGRAGLRRVEMYCDLLVGAGMCIIGGYGVRGAIRDRHANDAKKQEQEQEQQHEQEQTAMESGTTNPRPIQGKAVASLGSSLSAKAAGEGDYMDITHNAGHRRAASLAIGVLHGVAGPGGVLGVLPAVEMAHWQSSTLYLAAFILASTLSRGLFAACYGELTKRLGRSFRLEYVLRVCSSGASVLVGVAWLAFTALGRARGGGASFGAVLEG